MRVDLNTVLLCLVILAHGCASRIPSGESTSIVAVVPNVIVLLIVSYVLLR